MGRLFVGCDDVDEIIEHFNCCNSCHEDHDEYGYDLMWDEAPRPVERRKPPSRVEAMTCCNAPSIPADRAVWARLAKHARARYRS